MINLENSKSVLNFENKLDAEKNYRIILKKDGRIIGGARLEFRNRPFKYYWLENIYIDKNFKNKKIGTQLLREVNQFLRGVVYWDC
jgi:GNAT superfamily N-acetyltransferase